MPEWLPIVLPTISTFSLSLIALYQGRKLRKEKARKAEAEADIDVINAHITAAQNLQRYNDELAARYITRSQELSAAHDTIREKDAANKQLKNEYEEKIDQMEKQIVALQRELSKQRERVDNLEKLKQTLVALQSYPQFRELLSE